MTISIVSDVISIEKPATLSTSNIENILETNYGSLIRWAILDITESDIKICITYEKEV